MALFRKKEEKKTEGFHIHESAASKKLRKLKTLALKGEVKKEKYSSQSKLGEPHPFDYDEVEAVCNKAGFVGGAVNKTVDFVWGAGFHLKSSDENAKSILEQWMRDVSFALHGRTWLKEALMFGTSYLEMSGAKPNSTVDEIKPLSAKYMYIKTNNKGAIEEYTQSFGTMSDKTEFKTFQIAHLALNRNADLPYGYGMIYSSLRTVEGILKNQKDMQKLIERKANSPIVAKLGSFEEPASQQDVEGFGSKMAYMNAQTEWAVGHNVDLQVLDFKDVGKNYESAIDHQVDMLIFGIETPEVLMGRGRIPEGLAKVQMDAFERRARSIQKAIEVVIEQKIFPRVLQANGIDARVEFVWGQPSQEEENTRIAQITELLKNPMLNTTLAGELEKELATLMGIDPDLIEDPAQQREREEQRAQPIVPGSNEQMYEAKIVSL